MRSIIPGVFLSMALLMPNVGIAQVFSLPSPAPEVTAANADWQIRGEPIFHAGSLYYPAGPTVFFDGKIMARTGVYNGVPLYADMTLEPYSIVFVPIGRNLMRPYERRREGELAGTVGSRPPSFPIQRDGDLSVRSQRGDESGAAGPDARAGSHPEAYGHGTADVDMSTACSTVREHHECSRRAGATAGRQRRSAPAGNDGVWIEFEGARWFSSGQAVASIPTASCRRAAIAVSSCTGTQWEVVPTPSSSPSSQTVPSPRTRAAERFGLPRPVWFLGWVSLATDAASEAIYPLLPFFLTQVLGAGAVSLGIVEGAAEAANSVLKILSGRLADRSRAKRPIVIAGYALSSAVRPLIALAQSWTHVFTVRLVDRIGKGIRGAPRDAMLATWATPSTRGKVYGFHRAMDHAGAVVGPAVASLFLCSIPANTARCSRSRSFRARSPSS